MNAETRKEVRVFFASSSELEQERKEIDSICTKLIKTNQHLLIEPIKWEYDIETGSYDKERIQDEINPLLEESNIVIVIFYSKIGVFTFEEYKLAISKRKKVFVYFKTGFSPNSSNENQKYGEVLAFKENLIGENKIIFQEYATIDKFGNLIQDDLNKYFARNFPSATIESPKHSETEFEFYKHGIKKVRNDQEIDTSEPLIGRNFEDLDSKQLEEFWGQERVLKEFLNKSIDVNAAVFKTKLNIFNLIKDEKIIKGTFLCLGSSRHMIDVCKSSYQSKFFVFDDNEGNKTSIVEHIKGNLLTQYHEIIGHLKKNLYLARDVNKNNEDYEIPYIAFKEILANAFIHREYDNDTHSNIQIELYPNRLEIKNPGNLVEGLNIRKIADLQLSRVRNVEIAFIFFLYNIVEQAGKGIKRAEAALKAAGLKPLEFYPDEEAKIFRVIIRRKRDDLDLLKFEETQPTFSDIVSDNLRATPASQIIKNTPLKAFISSTYLDLKDYRQVAINVVNRYKLAPLAMEFLGAEPLEPTSLAEKEIYDCDIFIGIYAYRYGFINKGQKESIIQLEYELAKQLNKPCLCFIIHQQLPWQTDFIEFDKQDLLRNFLVAVRKENTVAYFTSLTDFESKLSVSLGKLLLEKTSASHQPPATSNKRLIPIAPTPFIAHPYPLPRNFTGREAEKALLSNWLHNAPEPMLVLEAIGGMGKTSLSWVWLQQEVLAKNAELDGVLWWSFYDEPFETFVQSLFFYLTSKEVKVERGALSDQLNLLHSILFNNRFLLILDGFERALRGYSGMKAMFIQEPFGFPSSSSGQAAQGDNPKNNRHAERSRSMTAEEEHERRLREPVHPQAGQFLKRLATGKCKTLMTTRLFPAALEDVTGVRHERLAGLSPSDSVRFFRSEGLTGTRAEMERAAAVYGNHPLMLKLLSTALKRQRAKDMADAFKLKLIDQAEPQKILATSFNLLNKEEQQIATTMAVFRSSFGFEAVQALFPEMSSRAESRERLWELLQGLQQLGFLFYDESHHQFDFHPILRSFLYDHLTTRDAVHQRAVAYLKALPAPEKVVTLADVTPVIEFYHHLIGAGKFDEAFLLYRDRLANPIYYQLANYNLDIELKRALFSDGEERPPRLQKEADQAWTLNSLANSYALSGQPAQAVPLFLMQNTLQEKANNKKNLIIGLGNVATQQYMIDQLSASAAHLLIRFVLCQEIQDDFNEAIGHQEWGRVLAYQGRWQFSLLANRAVTNEQSKAESELAKSTAYWKSQDHYQALSVDSVYCALALLLQARLSFFLHDTKENFSQLAVQALQQLGKALAYAEKTVQTQIPVLRDFVRAYSLLGETLLHCLTDKKSLHEQKLEIHFYDEPFQKITETLRLQKDNALHIAECCLSEALRRCRSVNMVLEEPNLLLAWARFQWASVQYSVGSKPLSVEKLAEIEATLKEAREVAERAGYRLVLADIHLFGAEVGLELGKNVETGRRPVSTGVTNSPQLLGLSIAQHLQKAKEYALDISEYSHLYQSTDPHFYDGIPEAAMLKRGMTQQERIDNGYWVAYQIALAMEERLAAR